MVANKKEERSQQKQWMSESSGFRSRKDLPALTIVALFMAISVTTTLANHIPLEHEKRTIFQQNSRHVRDETGTYEKAAVSSDDPRCSEIGSKILKKKGSAVDAAISTLLCLEVVNPHHSGIGGGFFMTVLDRKTGKSIVMDAREYAPAKIPRNLSPPLQKGLSVGVPLALDGFWKIHQRFGHLKWEEVFKSVIDVCIKGYKVDASLAEAIEKDRDEIMQDSSLSELFINQETGELLKEGDILKRPIHAQTLKTTAKEGISAFYNGKLAKSLVSEVRAEGGVLTLQDLAKAKSTWKNPIKAKLAVQDLTIITPPPPSSGCILAFMLNVLKQFEISDNEATNYQRFVETLKFGFAQRTYIGDDAFIDTKEAIANQTSKEFAQSIAARIVDDKTFPPEYYNPHEETSHDAGTTHISVVDSNGLVVATTFTINNRFGAMFRSRSLDIVLNDEMNDFSNITSFGNAIKPGKKPMSSMVPSIFLDENDEVVLVIGAAGSTKILTSVTMVAWNYLQKRLSLPESMALPRVHHQLFPNVIDVETTVPEDIITALKSYGHEIISTDKYSHVNVIARDEDGEWVANSEPRMDSGVAGF